MSDKRYCWERLRGVLVWHRPLQRVRRGPYRHMRMGEGDEVQASEEEKEERAVAENWAAIKAL